jgi:hypothetical protein
METGKNVAKGARSRKPSPTRSDTMRALWADSEYRERLSKKRKQTATQRWADPKARKKLMDGQRKSVKAKKEWWARPANLKMMTEVRREQAQRPEEQERKSRMAKNNWRDPETRHRLLSMRRVQAERPEEKIRKQKQGRYLWQDPAYRAKQMASRRKAGMYGPKWKAKVSKSLKGREVWNKGLTKDTDERLMKRSKALKGQVPDYNKFRCWYPSEKVKKVRMRSSWEVAYALYLDRRGTRWQYEPHYFNLGKAGAMVPDFYLLDKGIYVELKGWASAEYKRKAALLAQRYPDVEIYVLTKVELRAMGIIDAHGKVKH